MAAPTPNRPVWHSVIPPKDVETYFEWLQADLVDGEAEAVEHIQAGETLTVEES